MLLKKRVGRVRKHQKRRFGPKGYRGQHSKTDRVGWAKKAALEAQRKGEVR